MTKDEFDDINNPSRKKFPYKCKYGHLSEFIPADYKKQTVCNECRENLLFFDNVNFLLSKTEPGTCIIMQDEIEKNGQNCKIYVKCPNSHDYLFFDGKKFIVGCKSCGVRTKTEYPVTPRVKTERKLGIWLKKQDFDITPQAKFEWCKNKRHLPFDFCIESLKSLIELDGGGHFIQVANWDAPEETTKTDVYKMRQAILNGYTIIRILQEDVYYDRNDWQNKLLSQLINREHPIIKYISNDNCYNKHKKMFKVLTNFQEMMDIHLKPGWKEFIKNDSIEDQAKYIAENSKRKALYEAAEQYLEIFNTLE